MRDYAAQTAAEYARSTEPHPEPGAEEALANLQGSRALAAMHAAEKAWKRYRFAADLAALGNERAAIREQSIALYDVTDALGYLREIARKG